MKEDGNGELRMASKETASGRRLMVMERNSTWGVRTQGVRGDSGGGVFFKLHIVLG